MSPRCLILPKADQDLDVETDYLAAEAGLKVALRFLEAARDTFDLICTQPGMGWPCRIKNSALASVRVFRIRSFENMLVFYRVAGEVIEVVRVLHSSQDLEILLSEDSGSNGTQ